MPRRKKSGLSQISRASKRQRQVRSQETEEEHGARLAARREYYAELVSSETASQREERLATVREQVAGSRASETMN